MQQAGMKSTGAGLGIMLGLANTFVVSIGMSAMEARDRGAMMVFVFMIGAIPALITGAVLGWIAGRMADASVASRRIALIAPALFVVMGLGVVTMMFDYIAVSFIPTTVAALLLEKHTRGAPPPVPVAQAR